MERKSLIKKSIFVVIVILLLIRLTSLAFKESANVTDKLVKHFEVSQEDIISSGKEIIIKSFDDITNVTWLSVDKLVIEGDIDGKFDSYLFDMTSYELMLYDEADYVPENFEDYEIVKEIPGYGLLATKDKSIGLINDLAYTEILEDISYNDKLNYKLSDDMSKLLVYHAEKNTLVTYNFEKSFYRTIKAPVDEELLEHFQKRAQISPLGGYVSVEYHTDLIEESYFRIYGADSGKLYAEDVFGVNMSWAPDDTYVCYFYSKELQALDKPVFEDMNYIGRRIGYYDVEHKTIDYIDVVEDEKIISQIYWSDHTATTLVGEVTENIEIQSVLAYDFDTESYSDWQLDLEPYPLDTSVDLLNDFEAMLLEIQTSTNTQMIRLIKETGQVQLYEDVKAFDTKEDQNLYFYQVNDRFIMADQVQITVSNGMSQGFILLDDKSYMVLPNDDLSRVGVWFTHLNEIKILNVE
ncbi:hypothetical protein EZV73_09185 [Acidaminobacter sp. JC074]|uniref:hypothetical protein n=1 Tax=Acidaminobacter sp. JC074 TaxID=2530199 RepID=UPI001F0E5AB9|nr:hypothetical protein [Acidaminobacter sp. JC074]MCH4887746.1 hypothetical protein [Acidaminobacter sp. JC074]